MCNVEGPDYRCGLFRGKDLYEQDGFIVHYFSRGRVEALAE